MEEKKKKTINHSKYIVGMDAYFPLTRVVNGSKVIKGESAGGSVTLHDINTMEEAKEEANYTWTHEYVGFFKQMWIKEDGAVVAFHSNFGMNKQKEKYFL